MSEFLTVVTGGSRGLGAALVEAFAVNGQVLSIATSKHAPAAPGVETLAADLTTDEGRRAVVEAVGKRKIDVLVHNAGMLGPRVPISEYPADEWERVLHINLTAVFRLTQSLLPQMRRPGSCILTLSSGAGRRAAPQWGAYAVSKFGIDGFSLLLADELKDEGIRVHSINPGAMRTQMRAAAYPNEDPQTVTHPSQVAPFFVTVATAAPGTYPVLLDAQKK